jgi:hypothetical protein
MLPPPSSPLIGTVSMLPPPLPPPTSPLIGTLSVAMLHPPLPPPPSPLIATVSIGNTKFYQRQHHHKHTNAIYTFTNAHCNTDFSPNLVNNQQL